MSARSLLLSSRLPWARLAVCLAAAAMAVPVGELLAHALTGWEATTEGYLWAEVLVSTLLFAPVACSARRAWVIPAAFVVGTLCTLAVYHPGLSAAMALNAGAVSVAALGGLIGKAIERR